MKPVTIEERNELIKNAGLISPKAASLKYGLQADTLRKWVRDGLILASQPGKTILIVEASLVAYLAAYLRAPDAGEIGKNVIGSKRIKEIYERSLAHNLRAA